MRYCNLITTSVTVRDCTSELAEMLRDARSLATERHAFVTVSVTPSTATRACEAKTTQGNIELNSLTLPEGVSSEGTVVFSPYGVPASAGELKVSKNSCSLKVFVNQHGMVSVPTQ